MTAPAPTPVVMTAAHAGFRALQLPLGGGGAVADRLALEWRRSASWPLIVMGAGPESPWPGHDHLRTSLLQDPAALVTLSERGYAAFCRSFSTVTTRELLSLQSLCRGSERLVTVCHDIAEGPHFPALAAAGIGCAVVFHVDVVDYFCRVYLRGWVRPERLTAWYDAWCRRGLERLTPWLFRLVCGQQRDAVASAGALVVPSHAMAEILRRCYPRLDPSRLHVIPWGCWQDDASESEVAGAQSSLNDLIELPGAPILATLSRISPEKGIDTLLSALLVYERRGGKPLNVVIAGAPAFMRGQSYLRLLKRQATRLRRCRIQFAGYADPAMKRALFSTADLYIFPSRHESYGLTLCEAISAGLPVISSDHYSARDLLGPDGVVLPRDDPGALADAIQRAVSVALPALSPRPRPFSEAAAELAGVIDRLRVT